MMECVAHADTSRSINNCLTSTCKDETSVTETIFHLQKLLKKINLFLKTHIAQQIIGDTSSSLEILNKNFIALAKEYKEIKALKATQDVSLEITKIWAKLSKFEDKITNGESYRKICHLAFQHDLMSTSEKAREEVTSKADEGTKDMELQQLKAELIQKDKEIKNLEAKHAQEKIVMKSLMKDVESRSEILTTDLAQMKKKLLEVTMNNSQVSESKEETKSSSPARSRKEILFESDNEDNPQTYKFSRFLGIEGVWYNVGDKCDAIIFVPNEDIILKGIMICDTASSEKYQCKYAVLVNGKPVETRATELMGNQHTDLVNKIPLNSPTLVLKGSEIEVKVWLAKDLKKHINIQTYAGYGGDKYDEAKNSHVGLFTVKPSPESENKTTLDKGQIAGLLYQLN